MINVEDNERSINELLNQHSALEEEERILLGSHPYLCLYQHKLVCERGDIWEDGIAGHVMVHDSKELERFSSPQTYSQLAFG